MRAVLVVISDAANRDGEHAHPGLAALMEGSLYSRSTVTATVARLVTEGWVEIEQTARRGEATVFRIPGVLNPEWMPAQTGTQHPAMDASPDRHPTSAVGCQPSAPNSGMGADPASNGCQSEPNRALIFNGLKANVRTQPLTLLPTPEGNPGLHPYWQKNPGTLQRLLPFAPPALLDGDLAKWCDDVTEGTEVYWDHQLREYVIWLETKPPSRRHKNLTRGFKAWIQEAIRRDQRRRTGAQRSR